MKFEPTERVRVSGYARLAHEYYDSDLHPTCAAFREGSRRLVEDLIPEQLGPNSVEVGAGASLLAPLLVQRGYPGRLLITDDSVEMLRHSQSWATQAHISLAVAPAAELPLANQSVDLVVGSLVDPYDNEEFWGEVRRVLRPGGVAVVTTPSWAWASRFRSTDGRVDRARFVLRSGAYLDVPSFVRPVKEERALIERNYLHLLKVQEVTLRQLTTRAPKLSVVRPNDPVVVGYLVDSCYSHA